GSSQVVGDHTPLLRLAIELVQARCVEAEREHTNETRQTQAVPDAVGLSADIADYAGDEHDGAGAEQQPECAQDRAACLPLWPQPAGQAAHRAPDHAEKSAGQPCIRGIKPRFGHLPFLPSSAARWAASSSRASAAVTWASATRIRSRRSKGS